MSAIDRYRRFRQQGLSHEEALEETNRGRSGRRSGRSNPAGALGDFAAGLGLGGTKSVTSLGEGFGQILDWLGVDELGEEIQEASQKAESRAEDYFDPQGGAGRAGELIGRIGGEIGTTIGTLGVGRATTAAAAPKLLADIQRLTRGSRLRSAIGATVAESPLSVARAASWSERQGTGLGRELGIELVGSALGGAFAGGSRVPVSGIQKGKFSDIQMAPLSEVGNDSVGQLLTDRQRIATGWFDQWNPIRIAARRMGGLGAERDVSGAISVMLGSPQSGLQSLKTGHGMLKLKQAYEPWLRRHANNLDDIGQAAIIRREKALRNAGANRRLDITDERLDQLYQQVMGDTKLKKATDELQDFFRENLELRRRAKIIDDDEMATIIEAQEYYVPLLGSEMAAGGIPTGRAARNVFQARRGVDPLSPTVEGLTTVQNPVDVLPFQTIQTYKDISARKVEDVFVELLDETGGIPGIIRPISPQEIKKRNLGSENLWSIRRRPVAEEADQLGLFGADKPPLLPEEDVFYEVLDQDLFDALHTMGPEASGRATDILKQVADFKRKSITLVPDFAVMSILRDWPLYAVQRATQRGASAAAESFAGGAIGAATGAATGETEQEKTQRAVQFGLAGLGLGVLARPGIEVASAGRAIAKAKLDEGTRRFLQNTSRTSSELLDGLGANLGIEADEWAQFVREGGLTAGLSYGQKESPEIVKHLLGKDERNSILVGFDNAKNVLETIGLVAENAPRLAMYRAMRAGAADNLPGSSVQEAIWSAQDVTLPFALRGKSKFIKKVAEITPFFNATLQGWAKIGRMFRGDPAKSAAAGSAQSMLAMGTAMSAPTVGLWMTNKDNPEYWDRPLWERNMFWLIPKPEGGFFRIPKPFELGYIFASLPERALDRWAQSGGIDSAAPRGSDLASEVAETLVSFATNPITGTLPIPAGLQPVIEQAVNRDLFRFKPIVPEYLTTRPGRRQTTPTTPVLANKIGDITGLSPLRVESLIQSLGGTVGRRAMDLVDVAGAASDYPTPASRLDPMERFNKVSGLARFNTQQYDIGNIEYSAWNILRKAKNVSDEYKRMKKSGIPESALAIYRYQYADELKIARLAGGELQQMNEIREDRNKLLRDQNISQTRLRALLDRQSKRGESLGIRSFRLIDRIVD